MDQIWIAVASGVPALLLGVLAYRRSLKSDALAAQSGVASDSRAGTAQVIEGLNSLIVTFREDNQALRDEARASADRHEARIARCEEAERQLNRLRRKYGENGANGGS